MSRGGSTACTPACASRSCSASSEVRATLGAWLDTFSLPPLGCCGAGAIAAPVVKNTWAVLLGMNGLCELVVCCRTSSPFLWNTQCCARFFHCGNSAPCLRFAISAPNAPPVSECVPPSCLLPPDFPESKPAVDDLKYCLERTNQRQQLLSSLKSALEMRLLHPGGYLDWRGAS